MTAIDISSILPLVILGATAVILVVQIAVKRNHATALALTLIGLVVSFWSLLHVRGYAPHRVSTLLVVDTYSLLFSAVIIVVTAVVSLMTYTYLSRRDEHREEMYPLIILAAIGSVVLTMADHFVSLILGLETLTIALYVMIGYLRDEFSSLEAGIKYLILAAASSAFLLFGMGLIYAETGAMEFPALAELMGTGAGYREIFLLVGTALVIVGAGFKLGVVPFHMWTPDVYEGAPAPVTAFIATVSKTAMVALLLRYVNELNLSTVPSITAVLSIVAIASMLLGNILALMQSNLKRLLAYSSIAHLGYLLVVVVAGGAAAVEAATFYMIAYSFTTLGAFGLIGFISGGKAEIMEIESYRGLFWRRPFISAILSVMMLSLAGIPLTAGFIGKFLLLSTGVSATLWTLVIILVVASAIGLYYYLRVIAAMLSARTVEDSANLLPLSAASTTILTIVAAIVIYLGVQPATVLDLIRKLLPGS